MERKKCFICESEPLVSEFAYHPKSADGLCNACNNCRSKKVRKPRKNMLVSGNPALSSFKPRDLIEELRVRGYKGKLTYTQEITL